MARRSDGRGWIRCTLSYLVGRSPRKMQKHGETWSPGSLNKIINSCEVSADPGEVREPHAHFTERETKNVSKKMPVVFCSTACPELLCGMMLRGIRKT